MLAASFLLLRIFVDKMMLNADILMLQPGQRLTIQAYENLRVLSGIFYHTFLEIYGSLPIIQNNLEVIELTEKPSLRFRPIRFRNPIFFLILLGEGVEVEPDHIISGVPPIQFYNSFFIETADRYEYFKNKFRECARNLVDQVNFQDETENLKKYKTRIQNREKTGKRLRKIFPELSKKLYDYASKRKKELFLVD